MIGPGGTVALGLENVVLFSLDAVENDTRGGFDLNLMPMDGALSGEWVGVVSRDESKLVPVGGTQDSNPFNLGPIIKVISRERKMRKRGLKEVEGFDAVLAIEDFRSV